MEKIKRLQGRIRVLTEKDGIEKVLYDVENQVTELMEDLIASFGLDTIYSGMSCIEAGQNFLYMDSPVLDTATRWNYGKNKNKNLCVYFLNLTDEDKNALSKSSVVLPLYSDTLEIDSDKIVGFATSSYTSSTEKEGYITKLTGVNLINPRRHCLKFKWDVGVMNGSYNAIAVGFNITDAVSTGISIYRGLDISNFVLGETASAGFFLRPGIKTDDYVITEDYEILVGGTDNAKAARNVINLITGEVTLLESTDARYGLPLYDASLPQTVCGGYFFYQESANYANFYRRPISSSFTSTYQNCFASLRYSKNSIFAYNGYIYSQKTATEFYAYDPSTLSPVASANLNIEACNFPPLMKTTFTTNSNAYTAGIFNIGSNYLVVDRYNGWGLVCSDLTDICGSIVKILPRCNTYNAAVVNGENLYFIREHADAFFGVNGSALYPTTSGTQYGFKMGVKMSKDNLNGNMLSYKLFDEPQTISTTKNTLLEYYYTFEQ